MLSKIKNYWYWYLTVAIILGEMLVLFLAGENVYLGIHDNLDIHITDYQLLRSNNAFFAHNMELPFLGGIDRDYFLSELSLYSFLYILFPNLIAYKIGYMLKILIALFSGILLGKELLGKQYSKYQWCIVLVSLTYGLLPLYPAFSFSFSSIPLFIYLILKIERTGLFRYFFMLFLYPLVSYFVFAGLFVLAYFAVYILVKSIYRKRIQWKCVLAFLILSAGYVTSEYRLFLLFFASGETTIRDTMAMGNAAPAEVIQSFFSVFVSGIFHAEDVHRFLVLPVVFLALIIKNFLHIRRHDFKGLLRDKLNLVFLLILFNCLIYSLYTFEPFRLVIETLIPPLKGWQFNRTVFFNPFLWYFAILLIAIELLENNKKILAGVMVIAVLLVPVCKQTLYNDFYNTVYVNMYRAVKHKASETLSYGEFFSSDLFEKAKKDIHYNGEYSAAYGFHPAVLSYNGIATLDGCFSYYSQSYKEAFRKIIEPALEESEAARVYFDEWGGRAYLFSGTVENIWNPERTKEVSDRRLLINPDAFAALGGTYIFSRIELGNAEELGFTLLGQYTDENSPYTISVYQIETTKEGIN